MGENKSINTENFKIKNNIISFNNTLLQISNISQVSVEQGPKKKFNFWSILIFIIGILMVRKEYDDFIAGLGIIIVIGVIFYVVILVSFNYRNDEVYLHIYLCSGNIYSICCSDTRFLEDILEVIEYCINNHYVQEIKVDFMKCKLYNSPLVIGNKNEVQQ